MSSTQLPDQGLLRAHETLAGRRPVQVDPDDLGIIDLTDLPDEADDTDQADDPERVAGAGPDEEIAGRLDSANEADLREQAIVVPEDEDERSAR